MEIVPERAEVVREKLTDMLRNELELGKIVGYLDGRKVGARSLILKMLLHQFGSLSSETQEKIEQLSFDQLENLGMDLLYFADLVDLQYWLAQNQ